MQLIKDIKMIKINDSLNYFYSIKFSFNLKNLYKIQIIVLAITIANINRFNFYDSDKIIDNRIINKNYTNYYYQYFGHIKKFITKDIIKRKELIKSCHKKPILKINHSGVDSGVSVSSFSFIDYISQYFKIELSSDPDYVYYGSSWDGEIKYPNAINICMETENVFPDMNKCDYAIGYSFQIIGDRYIQQNQANLLLQNYQQIKNARKNVTKVRKKFCGAMIKNPDGKFRNKFIKELNKYKKIENGGKYMNTFNFTDNPKIGKYKNKVNFLKQYKFSIPMENSLNTGYVSEKITTCFLAGTIPIYYGDTILETFINPKTFIQIKPWDNIKEKIKLIKLIDNDDKLYFNMLNEDLNFDGLLIKLQKQDYQDMADYIFFQDKKRSIRRGDSQFIKLI